ncbi:hypothetical protein PSCICP_08180 [Pseudomonas cichorii]|uniref:Uncharacterized protein n=1 Tax=Pseudomonas cichorii TaxID=36746 RepID=A0ABQ1DIL0_PSECI|nr:hypothetical protein PSCICP_08180 [Pseudomonas cichorii]
MPGFGADGALHVSVVLARHDRHHINFSIINRPADRTCSVSDTEEPGNDITQPSATIPTKSVGKAVWFLHETKHAIPLAPLQGRECGMGLCPVLVHSGPGNRMCYRL